MKKSIAVLFSGLCAGTLFAGMNNVVVSFSSVGPDTYADGTTVRDGETYALVWTPDGAEFAGFAANGAPIKQAEQEGQFSQVLIKAPVAEAGHCPQIQFQVDEEYLKLHKIAGGTWAVYILDTRKYATETTTVTIDGETVTQEQLKIDENGQPICTGVGGAVRGWGVASATLEKQFGADAAKGALTTGKAAKVAPPQIIDFKVRDGMAYLTLGNVETGANYGAAAGSTPGELKPTAGNPVCGKTGGKVIVVRPATEKQQFFQGIVK